MTSFIAAGGSGRSASFIPAVPAAWSVTTIAFIVHLLVCGDTFAANWTGDDPISVDDESCLHWCDPRFSVTEIPDVVTEYLLDQLDIIGRPTNAELHRDVTRDILQNRKSEVQAVVSRHVQTGLSRTRDRE